MQTLDFSLYLASPIVLLGLIVIFLRRKLNKEFPLFFIYMLYVPVTAALRMSVMYHQAANFWVFWTTEAIYGALGLLVLREVFHRLFALSYASYRWFRLLLPVAMSLILTFTLWETIYHPLHRGSLSPIVSAIYWFDLGVHLLEGIILLLVLVLTLGFPLSWRRYEFGILAGFGLNACVTIIAYVLRFQLGGGYEMFFRYGPPLAYLVTTAIWLHAFLGAPDSTQRPEIDIDEAMALLIRAKDGLASVKRLLGWRRRALSPPV